jgi:hypothetical protein
MEMQPQQRPTPPLFPPIPIDVSPQASPSAAPLVAVVFKEHRDDNGAPKTWWFAHIDHIDDVQGRLQLRREGYGVVLDVPAEEVEQVYIGDQETFVPRVHPSPWRPG